MATPTWALAECRFASAARTSGRCSTSRDGRLSGRSCGSVRSLSSKRSSTRVAGQLAGQRGEEIALLGQRLFERRQGGLGLGECRLLAGDVGAGNRAQALLLAQDVERLALGGDDAPGRLDLGAQRGLLDGRGDDVGGQRQIRRLELEALRLGQRLERFGGPTVGAEQVERVAEGEADREQAVDVIAAGRRCRQDARHLVLRGAETPACTVGKSVAR